MATSAFETTKFVSRSNIHDHIRFPSIHATSSLSLFFFFYFFPFRVPSNERCRNAIVTAWCRGRVWEGVRVSISKMRHRTDLRAMYGGRQLRRARGKSEIILRRVRVALPFPIETRINTGLERAKQRQRKGLMGKSERWRNRESRGPCTVHPLYVHVQGDTRARMHTRSCIQCVSEHHMVGRLNKER